MYIYTHTRILATPVQARVLFRGQIRSVKGCRGYSGGLVVERVRPSRPLSFLGAKKPQREGVQGRTDEKCGHSRTHTHLQ